MNEDILKIWEYIRGDLSNEEFESFIYNNEEVQEYFNEELYTEIISNDYKNNDSTFLLKRKMLEFQRQEYGDRCRCNELKNLAVIDMGDESNIIMKDFDIIVERGDPFWWLHLSVCIVCKQYWLVAQEERQNDVYCLYRIDNDVVDNIIDKDIWPDIFDKYENLLRIGYESGRSVRFIDPINDSPLSITIKDLAKEHPGITVSELSSLLNIKKDIAVRIAESVIEATRVVIDLRG